MPFGLCNAPRNLLKRVEFSKPLKQETKEDVDNALPLLHLCNLAKEEA